jgi:hypothetical protein
VTLQVRVSLLLKVLNGSCRCRTSNHCCWKSRFLKLYTKHSPFGAGPRVQTRHHRPGICVYFISWKHVPQVFLCLSDKSPASPGKFGWPRMHSSPVVQEPNTGRTSGNGLIMCAVTMAYTAFRPLVGTHCVYRRRQNVDKPVRVHMPTACRHSWCT